MHAPAILARAGGAPSLVQAPPAPAQPDALQGRDFAAAAALACVALLLYASTNQTNAYWSDGRLLLSWVDAGVWIHYHVAYLPVVHIAHLVLAPWLGADPEPAMLLVSNLAGAAAVGLTYLAARRLGAGPLACAAGAAALALSPAVWFFSTAIEVHTLHLAVAAGATLWLAGIDLRARAPRLAPQAMAWLLALLATHLVGLLWAPLLAWIAQRSLPPRSWRTVALAAVFLLALAALWFALIPAGSPVLAFLATGISGILAWDPAILVRELLLPAAALVLGLLAVVRPAHRIAFRAAGLSLPTLLLLLAPFLLAIPGFHVEERGAYAIALFPTLACLFALVVDWLSRTFALLVPIALLLHGSLAWSGHHAWRTSYAGHEWIEPLIAASRGHGLVLAIDETERLGIARHSRVATFSCEQFDLEGAELPVLVALAEKLVREHRERGEFVAFTRGFAESELGVGLVKVVGPGRKVSVGAQADTWQWLQLDAGPGR